MGRLGSPFVMIALVGWVVPQWSRAQQPSPVADAAHAPAAPTSTADIRFMQGMIGHHRQAVVMSSLVPSRTATPVIRLLAERIDVAQQDEVGLMQRWLEAHGAPVPMSGAAHDHMAGMPDMPAAMPGMLTSAQLAQLGAAAGPAFDRLFLTFMIQHHEGALTMVHELFATPGSGQEPSVYEFATDVEAGQRAEISRMRRILTTLPARPTRRRKGATAF